MNLFKYYNKPKELFGYDKQKPANVYEKILMDLFYELDEDLFDEDEGYSYYSEDGSMSAFDEFINYVNDNDHDDKMMVVLHNLFQTEFSLDFTTILPYLSDTTIRYLKNIKVNHDFTNMPKIYFSSEIINKINNNQILKRIMSTTNYGEAGKSKK